MLSLETFRLVLLILHFLGSAALIGPALLRHRSSIQVVPVMLTGAAVQVATGNGLIAANQLQGMHVIEAKMITKLALAVVALVLLIVAAVRLRRATKIGGQVETTDLERSAAGLGGVALLVAVIWS